MELSEFEESVLNALAQAGGSQEAVLREQWSAATRLDRDFTGVGYYLNFTVPASVPRLSPGRYSVGDVRFELEGIKYGGAALLWIEDGCLACLEVCLYGEAWPPDPRITQLVTPGAQQRGHGRLRWDPLSLPIPICEARS